MEGGGGKGDGEPDCRRRFDDCCSAPACDIEAERRRAAGEQHVRAGRPASRPASRPVSQLTPSARDAVGLEVTFKSSSTFSTSPLLFVRCACHQRAASGVLRHI